MKAPVCVVCGKGHSEGHSLEKNTDGTWAADDCLRAVSVRVTGARGEKGGNLYG